MNTIHLAAVIATYHAGLWDWVSTQSGQAQSALLKVGGLVATIIAIILLIVHRHSIGKLVGGLVVLVIGMAMITGGIISSLQTQVTQTVNQSEGAAPYSITRQL